MAGLQGENNYADELIQQARSLAFVQPDESTKLLNEAIEVSQQKNQLHQLALAHETLGTVLINAGKVADAYHSYQQAINTWQQQGNEQDMLEAMNRLATATTLLGNWQEADEILQRSLLAAEKLQDNHLKGMALMNLANLQIRKGDLDKAVASSMACASIFRAAGEYEKLLPALINLGVVYGMLKDDINALAIYESALDITPHCIDKNNVVNLHINLSELYVREGRYNDALKLLKEGKELATQTNYRRGFGYLCSTLGNAYLALDKIQKAYLNMLRAEKILLEEQDVYQLIQVYLDAGKLLQGQGKYQKALAQFEKAYQGAIDQQAAYIQMEACKGMADAFAGMQQHEEAYSKLKEYQALRESIFNEDKAKIVSEMQTRYEVEQMKAELAEFNLKLLRSQMNPHFIFNSINSINNFILRKETQHASSYLLKFSQLMRLILDHSAQQQISLGKEVQFLNHYLLLESLRFEHPFLYHIDVDDELSLHATMVPPMILQPYVENAIWHGLAHKQGQGKINVVIGYDGDLLSCIVEDNGVGRKRASELKTTTHQSKGLSLTSERLKILAYGAGNTQWVTVEDLVDDKGHGIGTRVKIVIPIKGI